MKSKMVRIVVLVLALILAGSGYLVWKLNHNTKANVVLVSTIQDSYWGDNQTLEGNVTEGSTQYVDSGDSLVEKIHVEVGDEVKAGDLLVTFDTTSYQLEIEQDKADIAVIESQIAQAELSVQRYSYLLPSESTPAPQTIVVPPTRKAPVTVAVVDKDAPCTGIGTTENPLVYPCSTSTVVTAEFLMNLGEKTAVFELYDGLGFLASWKVMGSQEDVAADWVLGEGVIFNKDGTSTVDFTKPHYGVLETKIPDYDDGSYSYTKTTEPDGEGNYLYSRAELASMVGEAQEQIKDLQLSLRVASLKLKQDEMIAETGKVSAKFDGVVMEVGGTEGGDEAHIVTVKGNVNGTISAYLGEMRLSEVAVGDPVTVTAYESGSTFTATIKEIGTVPQEGYMNWGDNPNNSYYPIICEPDEPVDLNMGEWCQVTLAEQQLNAGSIYIPLAFVRDDIDGTYTFVADENGRLEKRYLKTGKIIWGSEIEIYSGVHSEDWIAFPYGKEAYEGNGTIQVESIW